MAAVGPIFSAAWYRVAELTPRIRSHARVLRHQYRGETWHVLRDLASDRAHRFSPAGYLLVGLMDGRRTVQEIWEVAVERLGDEAPTQDEVIQLLGQLHAADVLQCDVPPDAEELLRRHEKKERRTILTRWASPLSWRIPLLDPERLLTRLLPLARPLLGVTGAALWLAVVGSGAVLVAVHWPDLSKNFLDRLLAPQALVLMYLSFPLIKTFHELGHAVTTKAFGGEVHDMGVMLLVFTPIPYVDASSASAFRSKWQRALVGAAGMAVELALASLALFVWLAAEPGVTRTLAYNAVVVAGISTLLFNGNPLLRYDGYYILSDLVEIPNLYTRSRAYLGYLAERYLFGRRDAEPPAASRSERAWFVGYAALSFLYRLAVVVAIALFLLSRFFYVGAALVLAAGVMWVGLPAARGLAFLVSSPRLRRVRARALAVTAGAVAAVAVLLFAVPVPHRTRAEGVVWIPEEAFVRAETEGFVERVVPPPGARVRRGDVLVVMADPALTAEVRVTEARVRELQARYDEQRPVDVVRAEILLEELRYARQTLARARERLAGLVLRAGTDGTFAVADAENLPGRFLKKGELLGHVVDLATITVRTVVPQASIDLIQQRTRAVEVRLIERLAETRPAELRREVPGASERLPSPALGVEGGGKVPIDPRDTRGTTALQKIFQVDLALPVRSGFLNVGGRVYVRFDHGWEPLGFQWYRELRQLFLTRLNV